MPKFTDYMTYDYSKVADVTVTDATYEQVAELVTPSRVAGTYKLTLSMLHTLNTTARSAYFRFSQDGGSTWVEVPREPKDTTDKDPRTLIQTVVHTGGIMDIKVQARKEAAGDVLIIDALNIIFERKI